MSRYQTISKLSPRELEVAALVTEGLWVERGMLEAVANHRHDQTTT